MNTKSKKDNNHISLSQYWRKPLDLDEHPTPVGHVYIIEDRCKGCDFCIEFCPNDVLEVSKNFNSKGYYPPLVAKQEKCVACKLCELICPEFAIYVLEEKMETKQDEQHE